jgi:hypothetical protein
MKKGSQPAHRWCTRQWTVACLVGHQAVCAEGLADRRPRAAPQDCPVCTEQYGNGRIQWSTAADPQRSADVARTPDSEQCLSGVHRTIRCAHRQKAAASVQRLELWGEAINTPQPAISRYGSPSNIPRHSIDIPKCSYTPVLNRITWWLA